jgi:tetratricopeptide (TPR) repeat protein
LLANTPRAAEAIDDFVEEVAQRAAAADADGAGRARHGLAIAYLNAGRTLDSAEIAEEALAYFVEAAREDPDSEESDAAPRVVALRHLLASAYQRLGQNDEAIAQLELISAACAQDGNPAGVGQMAEEIGDVLDRLDRDAAAALRYLTAAEAFRTAELLIEEFRNRRQHATSLLWSGDLPAALDAMARADELSLELPPDEHGTWERASMLYDGARVLRGAERLPEAALRAGAAARAFRGIDFLLQSAHSEMLLAELLLGDSRPAEAAVAAQRGLNDLPDGEVGREQLEALLSAAQSAL